VSEIAKGWSIAETYEKVHVPNKFAAVDVVRYHATLVGDTPPNCILKYGQMTKDEAIAMMRLLNASQTY
jgi:hypothetical protein